MPEIRFQISWPDGSEEICYSPSLIVQEYFAENADYDLVDFVERSRTSLTIASDRVLAKYGRPCGLALAQLQTIELKAAQYQKLSSKPKVKVVRFLN
jgi:uncharacterized repeat protein (TIGR04042 family)